VLARDRTGTWYNVVTEDDVNGWVAGSVTELLSDEVALDSIEIAATIPVPPTFTPTLTATPTSTVTPTPLPPPRRSSGDDDDDDDSSSGGDEDDDPPPPTEIAYP